MSPTPREAPGDRTGTASARNAGLGSTGGKPDRVNAVLRESLEELARREKTYHEIFAKAGDGIIKLDLEGRILMANRMAAAILGQKRPKGRYLARCLVPSSREKISALLSSIGSGRISLEELEVEIPGQDGPSILNLRAVPLRQSGEVKELEIIVTDITEKVFREKAGQKQQERAIVAGLSRHLSHVLLNSLTSASGYVKRVEKALGREAQHATSFAIINKELGRMEEVVRGYQDYVKIVNLDDSSLVMFSDFLADFMNLLKRGGDADMDRILRPVRDSFILEREALAPGPGAAHVDPSFLRLGLAYLLKGAVHYALGVGMPPVRLAIDARNTALSGAISFTTLHVSIPGEIVSSMLCPWEHQMLQQTFEDWGISIAEGVAERHHGDLEIAVTSEGTCYTFRLPLISA